MEGVSVSGRSGCFLQCGPVRLGLDKPAVMGVLNVTPDSFSDGGTHLAVGDAVAHALRMVKEGATVIDVGGESTRPGADRVDVAEECRRVIPVLKALKGLDAVLSVDTRHAAVMEQALDAGANMVNDICGLQDDDMFRLARDSDCGLCVMHMQGEPGTMQNDPRYEDVVGEVAGFLKGRIDALTDTGVSRERICIDPGFGFGKTLDHNYILLGRLERLAGMGCPVLVGISRKSMLGKVTGKSVGGRVGAGVAAALLAVERGARLIRTHDVAQTVDALRIREALCQAADGGKILSAA